MEKYNRLIFCMASHFQCLLRILKKKVRDHWLIMFKLSSLQREKMNAMKNGLCVEGVLIDIEWSKIKADKLLLRVGRHSLRCKEYSAFQQDDRKKGCRSHKAMLRRGCCRHKRDRLCRQQSLKKAQFELKRPGCFSGRVNFIQNSRLEVGSVRYQNICCDTLRYRLLLNRDIL